MRNAEMRKCGNAECERRSRKSTQKPQKDSRKKVDASFRGLRDFCGFCVSSWDGGSGLRVHRRAGGPAPQHNSGMNLQKIFLPILGVLVVAVAYRSYGWPGVALAAGGIVMWMLLHFTRMMKVLQRASNRPVGYVDSAVMLNAKLRPGVNLLHVVAMTRALGEQVSTKGAEPEIFRWTDGTASHVTCEFRHGKLVKWELFRPQGAPEEGAPPST
jgi:hypothetical protein